MSKGGGRLGESVGRSDQTPKRAVFREVGPIIRHRRSTEPRKMVTETLSVLDLKQGTDPSPYICYTHIYMASANHQQSRLRRTGGREEVHGEDHEPVEVVHVGRRRQDVALSCRG